jgi:HSP20 family protein
MSGTSLQSQGGNRPMARRQDDNDPFMPFRRQMNRLFDDFFSGTMLPRLPMMVPAPMLDVVVTPQIEVSETEKEIRVTAELPGIDPNKVEVSLADDVLTIRGEKQPQKQSGEKERDYHLSERSYGTFARYLRLPFHADPDKIQASFKDGVLTIVVPKPEEMQQKMHRIPVANESQSGDGSHQEPQSGGESQQGRQSGSGSQQSAGTPSQQAAE